MSQKIPLGGQVSSDGSSASGNITYQVCTGYESAGGPAPTVQNQIMPGGSGAEAWYLCGAGNDVCKYDTGPHPPVFTMPFTSLPNTPRFLTVGPDDNIWTADYAGTVYRASKTGANPVSFPQEGNISGIATANGSIWFVNRTTATVAKMNVSGAVEATYPLGNYPDGIAPGGTDYLWVFAQGRVVKMSTTNGAADAFTPPTGAFNNQPTRFATTSDGHAWVATTTDSVIGRFDATGQFSSYSLGNYGNIQELFRGGDGKLWFATSTFFVGTVLPSGEVRLYNVNNRQIMSMLPVQNRTVFGRLSGQLYELNLAQCSAVTTPPNPVVVSSVASIAVSSESSAVAVTSSVVSEAAPSSEALSSFASSVAAPVSSALSSVALPSSAAATSIASSVVVTVSSFASSVAPASSVTTQNASSTPAVQSSRASSVIAVVSSARSSSAGAVSSRRVSSAQSSVQTALCGNGKPETGEACDDGNIEGNDGCSPTCVLEAGFRCSQNGCLAVCGDGMVKGGEECDDNNWLSADGCTADCVLEPWYACPLAGRPCTPVCGDGKKLSPETCDDANTRGADGCDASCALEQGWVCAGVPDICIRLPSSSATSAAYNAAATPPLPAAAPSSVTAAPAETSTSVTSATSSFDWFATALQMGIVAQQASSRQFAPAIAQTNEPNDAPSVALTAPRTLGSSSSSSVLPLTAVRQQEQNDVRAETDMNPSFALDEGTEASSSPTTLVAPAAPTLRSDMGPAALLATASPLSAVAFAPLRNAAGPVAQAYEPYVQTAYVQQFAASPALNQTGPASVAVMAAGAGAGLAWVRRRKSHTPRR